MPNQTILSIHGLPGSGKSEVIGYLQEKFKWPKVYFGEVTFDEMKVRGLEINEANEREVREDLRAKFGLTHYAEQVIKKIEAMPDAPILLVESLYSWPEYLAFKKRFGKDFKILAVYASPQTRYARLASRPVRPLDEATAVSRDHAQIENLTQAGPIAMADWTVVNEGDVKELHEKINEALDRITRNS